MAKQKYIIYETQDIPRLVGDWNGKIWSNAEILQISNFRSEGSKYRPSTQVKLLYNNLTIYVIFRVKDRYVKCVHTDYFDQVSKDSCVEWFVKPKHDKGYFNIEINCGGTLRCSYIEDPTRDENGVKRKFEDIPEKIGRKIKIFHSLPCVVDPEISKESVEWIIEYSIPLTFFEKYVGLIGQLSGQKWSANFYKCGDETSHPHWAAWAPVKELDFHRPEDFETIQFE